VHQNHSPFEGTKQLSYQFSLYASVTGTGSKTPIVSYHFTVGPTTFFEGMQRPLSLLYFCSLNLFGNGYRKATSEKKKKITYFCLELSFLLFSTFLTK